MKLPGVLRFELAYQLRRPWPWLSMAVLLVFAFVSTRVAIVPVTLPQDFILNSPFIIASVTVFSCQIWLLLAPAVSGESAARDVHTGMHPLVYTSQLTRIEYLGGRFLAALVLNAVILLAVQAGSLLAVFGPGANPDIVGPFRPTAYLAAYGLIALPNALIATSFQFSAALMSGRPMASYVGSFGLFFLSYPVTVALYLSPLRKFALLADPIGVFAIMNEMMSNWTIVEKNVRMFALEGPMIVNRVLWVAIAMTILTIVFVRFQFAHRVAADPLAWLRSLTRRSGARPPAAVKPSARVAVPMPRVQQSFGSLVHLRQVWSIARSSFSMIARSPGGLFLLVVFPMFVLLVLLTESEHWGIPIQPRTGFILSKYLTAPITLFADFRVIIPILIIYFAGELVWRERDAAMNENVDAMPVPEWVLFAGKYAGLALFLVGLMGSLMATGMIAQSIRGLHDFRVGQYLQILLGLQLPEYLLFAALAFAVHAVVNQKYLGHLIALVAYFLIIFASLLGIEHNLLIYTASPAWSFTDMRGFGGSLGPWLWFKLYWAAWAVLLAVVARLMWVRGREPGFGTRMHLARSRFNRATAGATSLAVVLVLALGGFIFYNTNVLNEFLTSDEQIERRADYERVYGKFEGIPQPRIAATTLRLEFYPDRHSATVTGTYRLVNQNAEPIDAVHLEPAFYVDTRVSFERRAKLLVDDRRLGHVIYGLETPLLPGDSMMMHFDVTLDHRGFSEGGARSSGAGISVLANGSQLAAGALPLIGYHRMRELWSAEDRRKHGLPRQITLPPPGDVDPDIALGGGSTFDAVVGTNADQIAVAPGELRRTWTKSGRRYFHYVSDVPITGTEMFFSANYSAHRESRNGVDIQVYVHPGHVKHRDRLLRGARAALDYYSAQFGPYPYHFLQIVEQPGNFLGMGVDGSGVITGGEGFFLLDPQSDGFDGIFEIVAHEMGHQWWGMQLTPAFAEGGGVISESLAWYSAMQLVKKEKGREALRRFMSFMREPNPWPALRTGLPLLRSMDPWANYRKGPYAMHALSEYVGEDRVNSALRTLIEKKSGSLATTLDMYRELQAVTPDSLKPLLHDLFEVNVFWTFDTKGAKAEQTSTGEWQVTLDLDVHKVIGDSAGVEKEVPMTESVEIGIFAAAKPGEMLGSPLHLQKYRVSSGRQTITITVPTKPARAGIDPYNLLDWEEGDNIEPITTEK